jgi:alanine-alpha-ketoisovalerate/valine-pyruvate aminotransferase
LANKGILKYTVEKLTNLVPKKEGTILYWVWRDDMVLGDKIKRLVWCRMW